MANEKRVTLKVVLDKGGFQQQLDANLAEDFAGKNFLGIVQTISTSWTAVNVTGLASVDLLAARNSDGTNYVELATANDGSGIFAKLTAGRGCFISANPSATYYARANTAACDVEFLSCEP
jgi:hypothetical protein